MEKNNEIQLTKNKMDLNNRKNYYYYYYYYHNYRLVSDRSGFGKSKNYFAWRKKANTIQYGYRKRGTRARVSSQTLAHGKSEN